MIEIRDVLHLGVKYSIAYNQCVWNAGKSMYHCEAGWVRISETGIILYAEDQESVTALIR